MFRTFEWGSMRPKEKERLAGSAPRRGEGKRDRAPGGDQLESVKRWESMCLYAGRTWPPEVAGYG